MQQVREIRDFTKRGDALPIPNLIQVQVTAYQRFLQKDVDPAKRKNEGLEALLREVFPIESYDGNLRLEYISYDLAEPRYTPDECRALRLTYGMPFRIQVRFVRKDKDEVMEDSIYLGEIPIMIGGGEFIINGAERVIVNQLHRSPGVDFLVEVQEGDRPLHGCRVIPERGSWIECSVTKKDSLAIRIDQSSKLPATTFLRALDPKYGTSEAIIREFYDVQTVKVKDLQATHYAVSPIIDAETGEELVRPGAQIGDALQKIQASDLKTVDVVTRTSDPLILNTLAEDTADSHESALLKIYARLRPGNPPQLDKAKTLFEEKFYDENRYRLGRVGRFRINRKFDQNVPETVMTLRSEDMVNSLKYMFKLRSGEGYTDDIDHLGNRRLRTIDELAAEELRKGFLKLRRTVQERMSLKDPNEIGRIAELVNSKSISSAIDFFFGRGELSQVVDQTNPLSTLTHERRLSALGPGGLNRKRAGFEVRDVHISHYGRICPIETPEGTNIGLIASLAIYSDIDDYGFLVTPYRVVEDGKVNGKHKYLRADEEMKAVLAPPDVVESDGSLKKGLVLARVEGDLATVPSKEVQYVDIGPRQTVSVSAALIPFLEHDDANRALMGSNMQRQAVPLLRTDPPLVATGLEKAVAHNSGMVVRAERSGVVTYVDSMRILIDNADEYVLRKFVGLNERTCLNQKPIVKKGQRVKKGQIIADGAATHQGELALGRNALVAFMTFDGYNFEDAIVISQRLVKEDIFTSIHIEEYDVEIRETKLGREEFTRDIPNVSERALANLDENGIVRIGTRVGPGDILVGKVAPKSKSELTPEEKLLHAIFGRAGEDVKNDSLEMPAGEEGVVIGAQRFSRRMHLSDEQKKALKKDIERYEKEMDLKAIEIFRQMVNEINEVTGQILVDPNTRQKVGQSDIPDVILEQIENFQLDWVKGTKEAKAQAEDTYNRFWPRVQAVLKERDRKMEHMKRGDELPSGVLEMVKVYVATKRPLSVGDKMAGRHGNKGVIARIVPEEDMPFLEDGTPVDILLNPLGVPSRMNVGQILETHLGWAMAVLGQQAITPVFDGATEEEIFAAIDEANKSVARRQDEAALAGVAAEMEAIVRDEKDHKKLLDFGFSQWLSSFKVLYTDTPKRLSAEELRDLETALQGEYPDPNPRVAARAHLPRFNRKPAKVSDIDEARERVLGSPTLAALFNKAKQAISDQDGQPWLPSSPEILHQIEDRQGLYFFKNRLTGRVNEGYIGLAGERGDQMLQARLKLHWSGPSANNFVQRFRDEAQYLLQTYPKPRPLMDRELAVQMPYGGKVQLYDGRTGEPFEQKTTVGYLYMMKLHHLVDDKIHARATGPYSLITQQPLGGKARTGGQRFGEMEVWGLEAYGAAYILQELLTVKSDDVEGRTKIYESMVKGVNTLEAGTPVSFDVLCNEIRGLGLNIQLEKKKGLGMEEDLDLM